jgi:hypothetical protein
MSTDKVVVDEVKEIFSEDEIPYPRTHYRIAKQQEK